MTAQSPRILAGTRARLGWVTAALVLLASFAWARQVSGDEVVALAVDPSTPTTLYAGAYCAGVLKSVDGGDHWEAINNGLPQSHIPFQNKRGIWVSVLAIDPVTTTTLYAVAVGDGVFKSVNGGASWSAINTGLEDLEGTSYGYALAIDPTAPATLYAGAPFGVYRSVNGGESWQRQVNPPAVDALAIDPTTPTTLYAGGPSGVFRSRNAGESWQGPLLPYEVSVLAITPTTPATLYAIDGGGVFRSRNGGGNWSAVNTGLPELVQINALAIDPTLPTTLYLGTGGVGAAGVFRSLHEGDGWGLVNTGLMDQPVLALAVAATTPTSLYAATFNRGVFRSVNGGDEWQTTGLSGETCGDGLQGCNEGCDDGGESATCDADCTPAQCGDGTLNVTAGEQCDDGNRDPFDGCTNDCTVCGDGVVTPPEECDGGSNCDAECRSQRVVGDGTPQSCTEAALDAALAARSVIFDCGPDPVTITLTSEKAISADTIIDGGGRITLSGGDAVRIFTVDESAVLDVRNLTIADGRGHGSAGAIDNNGTLTLTNCTLSGNSTNGGISACTFSGVCFGGGIFNRGTLTLTNCTLSGNSANGGIHHGGGIANFGTLTLTNCTLSGNSADGGDGGGIFNLGTLTLTNCTLSGNSATDGGGIGGFGGYGTATLRNTIVANSLSGGDCTGGDAHGSHNLIEEAESACGLTDGVDGNLVGVDPLLAAAGLHDNGGPTQTIALLPDSPAIDTGDPEVCANPPVNGLDQRGYARPGTGHTQCSIGAYEADAPAPCVGDCGGDQRVSVDELVMASTSPSACCPSVRATGSTGTTIARSPSRSCCRR